ncbi:hypothetical protein EB118_10190 [bacterium]|nr:hypothetical protein [bacterium]
MKYTLIIDGGLGRTICSIPSVESFIANNPETLVISYWPGVYQGNRTIQPVSYDSEHKNLFQLIKNTKIIKPEPYYNINYNNERIHLVQAFDEELNSKSRMVIPRINLSYSELQYGANIRSNAKKIVCFQPFGSTAVLNHDVFDNSVRSLTKETTQQIVNRLRNNNIHVALMDNRPIPFLNANDFYNVGNLHYRDWFALIANCDYFIGVDSSGQHIARSFDIPGTVFVGGTSVVNISYPDFFRVVYKEGDRQYMPFRLSERDYRDAQLLNWDLIHFSKQEIDDVCDAILNDIFRGSND